VRRISLEKRKKDVRSIKRQKSELALGITLKRRKNDIYKHARASPLLFSSNAGK
jgi:hypothetical protein